VAPVPLVTELVAGDRDLLRVHDDDEVAGVAVARVPRRALAREGLGDDRREAAEVLALRVDDPPLAIDGSGLCADGGHEPVRPLP
jgi:hypothetical protein